MVKDWRIFCLGTNNWQSDEEFAPGSGILHESHHNTFNNLDNVKCYSVWPSQIQRSNPSRKDYQVFPLEHPIPICESVSPNSSYRWHSMSEGEFSNYCNRLLNYTENYLDKIEQEDGPINLFIAHHSFINPVILSQINKKRCQNGKQKVPLSVFVHGTAMKMYKNEFAGLPDFDLRFFQWIVSKNIFEAGYKKVDVAFTISEAEKKVFSELFPNYDLDNVVVSPNGFNDQYFKIANPRYSLKESLEGIVSLPEGKPISCLERFDKTIIFTGKFANWKRLDALLLAAKKYETELKENKNLEVATLIVGTGPEEDKKFYYNLAKDLDLKNTFFIGPQNQKTLSKLNSAADVGVYPSKDEPFGLVFLECMACGTPVIGANSGGPKDYVTEEVGALVPEIEDKKIFSENLSNYIQRALIEDWKTSKGPLASKKAHDNFSTQAQCLNILKEVEKRI